MTRLISSPANPAINQRNILHLRLSFPETPCIIYNCFIHRHYKFGNAQNDSEILNCDRSFCELSSLKSSRREHSIQSLNIIYEIRKKMTDIITRCKCEQFEKSDPGMRAPVDLAVKNHYISHGPIQPRLDEFPKTSGRSFRQQWYVFIFCLLVY